MGCVDKFGIFGLHLLVGWYQLTPCPGLSLLRLVGWVVALWLFAPVLPLKIFWFLLLLVLYWLVPLLFATWWSGVVIPLFVVTGTGAGCVIIV
jgi:hypothetical protein